MPDFYEDIHNEEMPQNETPLPPVDEQFKNILTDCKRSIYMGIVFSQPEDTNAAQDMYLLDQYLRSLSALYGILNSLPTLQIDSIDWSKQPWLAIPESAHEKTRSALLWYREYLNRNNRSIDRIPYTDYISNVLHRHPYSQLPNPDED